MLAAIAAGFVAGAWCGSLVGMLLWNEVVTRGVRDAYREHRLRAESRVQAWQRLAITEYADRQRVEGSRAMYVATHADPWSRKVPDLTVVK